MPDILIRMDMPQHCFNCSTKIDPDNRRCNIDGHIFEKTLSKLTCRRDDDCPLYELPEHGDLIDKNELRKWSYEVKTNRGKYQRVINVVNIPDLPVIVPASEEDG